MKILMTEKRKHFLSKYLVHSFVFAISFLGLVPKDCGAQESWKVLVKCLFSSTVFQHYCKKKAVPKHSSQSGESMELRSRSNSEYETGNETRRQTRTQGRGPQRMGSIGKRAEAGEGSRADKSGDQWKEGCVLIIVIRSVST